MAGKREKRRRGRQLCLPGLLLVLAAAGGLLLLGEPRGVAADSPVEAPLPAAETALPAAVPEAEPPMKEDAPAPAPEPEESTRVPVAESEAVEDTYFDDAVFLGDSRTEGFRLYSGLGTGTYLCATGATVESVFSKAVETPVGKKPLLDALAEMPCGKIYVMLGVNELGWNGTDIFRNQSAKLLQRLREDHPESEILLQSIIPVSAKQDAKGTYVNNGRVDAYNQVLRELAEEYGAAYVNVAEAVTDEAGFLQADWNFDGVHLNTDGCQAWLAYLRTHTVEPAEK